MKLTTWNKKKCATVSKFIHINYIMESKGKKYFVLSNICPGSINCWCERDVNKIHVLLGADVVINLFTDKIENPSCGLAAMETTLG